ncbi:hypothetical protein TNCV_4434041 [Trichonephila clavipes]|nr:hypothetical protein TNCV_4434041 [Trichonephila clavipes]
MLIFRLRPNFCTPVYIRAPVQAQVLGPKHKYVLCVSHALGSLKSLPLQRGGCEGVCYTTVLDVSSVMESYSKTSEGKSGFNASTVVWGVTLILLE